MIDRSRRWLVLAAVPYLALLPSNALSFWRSLAFGVAAACALTVVVVEARHRVGRPPMSDRAVALALAAWAGWAVASTAWSIDPVFTLRELKSDVLWGLGTMAICYVGVTRVPDGWRLLAGSLLAGLAFWPALAIGLELSPTGWNARLAHMGVVAYSTYLVTVAPLLLLLLWRPPLGFGTSARAIAVAALLFALVLISARMSDNRIVWIALAASLIVAALCLRTWLSPLRIAAAAATLMVAFALLFADAVRDRAERVYPPQTSVADTLAVDPRLAIWKYSMEHIRARPWHGYGYGRLILKDELREDTGDYLLTHAHNMFVSQWLQTGGIGVALLVALLGTLAARYLRFVRSRDVQLVRLGTLGLAVLTAFVIKNLTDDFFFRANAKLLFATHGLLLGAAALRVRELRSADVVAKVPDMVT